MYMTPIYYLIISNDYELIIIKSGWMTEFFYTEFKKLLKIAN